MYRKTPDLGRVRRDPCLTPAVPSSRLCFPQHRRGMQVAFRDAHPLPHGRGKTSERNSFSLSRREMVPAGRVRVRFSCECGGSKMLSSFRGCRGFTAAEPDCVCRTANANAPGSSPGQAAAARRASARDGASQSVFPCGTEPPKPIPGLAARSRDDERRQTSFARPPSCRHSGAAAASSRQNPESVTVAECTGNAAGAPACLR
jgi:hypothetical protein